MFNEQKSGTLHAELRDCEYAWGLANTCHANRQAWPRMVYSNRGGLTAYAHKIQRTLATASPPVQAGRMNGGGPFRIRLRVENTAQA